MPTTQNRQPVKPFDPGTLKEALDSFSSEVIESEGFTTAMRENLVIAFLAGAASGIRVLVGPDRQPPIFDEIMRLSMESHARMQQALLEQAFTTNAEVQAELN